MITDKPAAPILRNRNFRVLWFGQLLSAIGDPLFPFAVALLAIERGESFTGVGVVFAVRALASTVAVLAGGVFADRFQRKRVMIFCDAVRLVAILAIVIAAESTPLWILSGLVFIVGVGEAMFRPAYSALVPSLVERDQAQAANALTSLGRRLAGFLGPAMAGVLVLLVTVKGALLVDAATFGVSIASLCLVDEPRDVPTERKPKSTLLADARDGFRAARRRRWLGIEIGVGAIQIAGALAPWLVLLPVLSQSSLGGPGAYAALLASMSAGAVLGAVVGGRLRTRDPGVVANLGLLPFSAALVGLALGWPMPVLILLHAASGFGTEIYGVLWVTAVQADVPSSLLGRIFAIDQLGSLALLPLAMVLAGAIATSGGAASLLIVAGVVNLLTCVVPLVFPDVRAFRELRANSDSASPGCQPDVRHAL